MDNLLVSTKEASQRTGLSEFELRMGWKTGLYPAIELGGGGRGVRLRWNMNLLEAAIMEQMKRNQSLRASSYKEEQK